MEAPISAIIPTWKRLDDLRATLERIKKCDPAPAEIIVHVDAGDTKTAAWLQSNHSDIRLLTSNTSKGPGGGRNRLLEEVEQPYAASFDDDSYPVDENYFARLVQAFEEHPSAGIIAAVISHRGEEISPPYSNAYQVSGFGGGGCGYRITAWEDVTGYVPLPLAYGMEEVDLAHQLLDRDWKIVRDERLRVFHDTDLSHHLDPDTTAAAIANRALLAFLRYPVRYAGLGLAQYVNRVVWSVQNGRVRGIASGILKTPKLLWEHRKRREPVEVETVRKYRQLTAK
jgi:GT2 family glycosyltransferase